MSFKKKNNITFRGDKERLIIKVFSDDTEVYSIECINVIHFYVVYLAAEKYKRGQKVDMNFFKPIKKEQNYDKS